MPKPAIVEAFAKLEDPRRSAGQRYTQTLCLALFTLAVVAGNQGFLAIGDWLKSYRDQLLAWFDPPKRRNFALNLCRDYGFSNMAQAQRRCGQTLNTLKDIFK